MSSFSPWGGLGDPGEACVKFGVKETMLGDAPPRGGLRQKMHESGVFNAWFVMSDFAMNEL